MINGVTGSAVLVTGGSSGLGAAVVSAVEKAGGRPYVLDRQPPASHVPWVRCDLFDTRAAERATRQLAEEAGGLDGVVTAAGTDVPGRLADIAAETWERVVTVDLFATAAVVRAALPYLQRVHGSIVTVAADRAAGDRDLWRAQHHG